MKRILSWIALLLGANVFYYIACFVERLLVRIIGGAAEAGIAALVILYILFGSVIFAIITVGPWFAAHGIVALSQKMWKSNRAMRYWVLGVLYGLYYILCIILMSVGILVVSQPFWGYVEAIFMLYFCIALICTGVSCAKEDGPAPSRREQLQAKLDKEIAKEEKKDLDDKIFLRERELDEYWRRALCGEEDFCRCYCRILEYGKHDINICEDCTFLTFQGRNYIVRGSFSPTDDEMLRETRELSKYIKQEWPPSFPGDTVYHGLYVTYSKIPEDIKPVPLLYDVTVVDNNQIARYPSVKCFFDNETKEFLYILPTHPDYDSVMMSEARGDCYISTVKEAEKRGYTYLPNGKRR